MEWDLGVSSYDPLFVAAELPLLPLPAAMACCWLCIACAGAPTVEMGALAAALAAALSAAELSGTASYESAFAISDVIVTTL